MYPLPCTISSSPHTIYHNRILMFLWPTFWNTPRPLPRLGRLEVRHPERRPNGCRPPAGWRSASAAPGRGAWASRFGPQSRLRDFFLKALLRGSLKGYFEGASRRHLGLYEGYVEPCWEWSQHLFRPFFCVCVCVVVVCVVDCLLS